MFQLQYIHVSDGDRPSKRFTGAAITQDNLPIVVITFSKTGLFAQIVQFAQDLVLLRAVKDRRRDQLAFQVSEPAEVRLEDLSQVHARGNSHWVKDNVERRPIREERHLLHWANRGDDPFVPVPPRKLVADRDLLALRNEDLHKLVHASIKLVPLIAGELLHFNHLCRPGDRRHP